MRELACQCGIDESTPDMPWEVDPRSGLGAHELCGCRQGGNQERAGVHPQEGADWLMQSSFVRVSSASKGGIKRA